MPPLGWFVLPVTVAVACGGAALVLLLVGRGRSSKGTGGAGRAMEMECSVCQKHLIFNRDDLFTITPTEIALVVRTQPTLVGKKLYEYVCPYCEASHCFVIERGNAQWVAVNSYNPQAVTTKCMECGKPFQRPPWAKGLYDEKLQMAPQLRDEYGMICSRCGSRCCVSCCRKATPRDTLPFHCPRCQRSPVDKFLHF